VPRAFDKPRGGLADALRFAARRLDKRLGRRLARVANVVDPPIDISDHFTDHLHSAIAGMLHRGNLHCFEWAVRNRPSDAPLLEIGSFCGLSTNALVHYLRRLGSPQPFFTCDSWAFERAMVGDVPVSRSEYAAFVKDSFMRGIETFAADRRPHTVESTSDAFFEAWAAGREVEDVFGRRIRLGGPLAFVYVDGDHGREQVTLDWRNADRFLELGGFVLFDDSWDGAGWGACTVMPDVLASGRYELVAKNPNYFVRKVR
jgi:hypothetical protein